MPKITTGISVEIDVLKKGKALASKMRRTFSNYVEGLIMEDIGKSPVITNSHHDSTKGGLKRRAKS